MKGFSVTYEIITEESAKDGEYADSGFLLENASLREALEEFGNVGPVEADSWPISLVQPPRWFTAHSESPDMHTGRYENRGLHLPDSLTPSTRMRIARLIKCGGIKDAEQAWKTFKSS